jgi:hypothetical protein
VYRKGKKRKKRREGRLSPFFSPGGATSEQKILAILDSRQNFLVLTRARLFGLSHPHECWEMFCDVSILARRGAESKQKIKIMRKRAKKGAKKGEKGAILPQNAKKKPKKRTKKGQKGPPPRFGGLFFRCLGGRECPLG